MSTKYPLAEDDVLDVTSSFRYNPEYARRIDGQVRALGSDVVRLRNQPFTSAWMVVDASTGGLNAGTTVCFKLGTVTSVVAATTANLAASAGVLGVLVDTTAPGQLGRVAMHGVLPPGLGGLASTGGSYVRANTGTGRLERVAGVTPVDVLIGLAQADGSVSLAIDPANTRSAWLDPRLFGVIADDNTDNSTPLAALITAASSAGVAIAFQAGIIRFSTTQVWPLKSDVEGQGAWNTIFRYTGSGTAFAAADGTAYLRFANFRIDTTNSAAQIGLSLPSTYEVKVQNVEVFGAPADPITGALIGTPGFTDAGIKIWTKSSTGRNAADITLSACEVVGASGAGVKLYCDSPGGNGPQNVYVAGGHYHANGTYGIHTTSDSSDQQVTIQGSILEGNAGGQARLDALHSSMIVGAHFENSVHGAPAGAAAVIPVQIAPTSGHACNGLSIRNCFVQMVDAIYGIELSNGTPSTGIELIGNDISSGNSLGHSAIHISPAHNYMAVGNKARGVFTPAGVWADAVVDAGAHVHQAAFRADSLGFFHDGAAMSHSFGNLPLSSRCDVSVTSGNVTLNGAQYNCKAIRATGSPSDDSRVITFPIANGDGGSIGSTQVVVWWFLNSTSHIVSVKRSGGSATQVPAGALALLIDDGSTLYVSLGGGGAATGSATPLAVGTGAAGSAPAASHEDHVHPDDGIVRPLTLTIGTGGPYDTIAQIPSGYVVHRVHIRVTTDFNVGTLDLGQPGHTADFGDHTADTILGDLTQLSTTGTKTYDWFPDATAAATNVVRATIGGAPASGAAVLTVYYGKPLT